MNLLDIFLAALLVLIVALAVIRIKKAREKGGMCSCCDQAGICTKKTKCDVHKN